MAQRRDVVVDGDIDHGRARRGATAADAVARPSRDYWVPPIDGDAFGHAEWCATEGALVSNGVSNRARIPDG
jgi:hypothetical protein